MKTLTIRLTAPLQSYGGAVSFARRTTQDHPSKSAIIGMIAAALGYRRNDDRIVQLNELSYAVRADQVGRILTDFQTVEWKKDKRKITYRDYLQDAVFIVAVGSENAELIDQIHDALKRPKFQLSLGRRSNVPAGVLKMEEFPNSDPVATLSEMVWQASSIMQKKRKRDAEVTVEIFSDAELMPDRYESMAKDKVISFDQRNRRFDFRAETSKFVDVANPFFEENTQGTQE
ncbi:MAG TPA: type I-E CRISPR-associated protein Cas5/CasD [Lactobacillus sp.]|nr:type I-E CRISPR-associated protein Cas5/CasD [Lactobacillus sp.]